MRVATSNIKHVNTGDDLSWRRISPKYAYVDMFGYLLGAVATAGLLAFFSATDTFVGEPLRDWASDLDFPAAAYIPAVLGFVFFAGLGLFAFRRMRAIGYILRADDLLFKRGIMFERVVAVPYGRLQLVDIKRGPFSRALGLASLKFVTASAQSEVELPGLCLDDAFELRDKLVALAETRRSGL